MLWTTLASAAAAQFDNPKDGFADKLTLPAGVVLREPVSDVPNPGASLDSFQSVIVSCAKTTPATEHTIVPSLPSLRLLAEKDRPLLMRYLSASPAWRVYEQRGSLFATRRWKIDGDWRWKMHGYYSSEDFTNYFQCRTSVAFGVPWAGHSPAATHLTEGTNRCEVILSKANTPNASISIIDCGGFFFEQFEESAIPERRITKTALAFVENEFAAVLKANAWSSALLGAGATHEGAATIDLKNGMQPGIYQIFGWLNPGEAGTVYLRAFEITGNTRLSESNLFQESNEQIGWSDKASELFLYNAQVTIFEGDWGKPYGARFELWFRPASGAAERKLIVGNFKIEGWQR